MVNERIQRVQEHLKAQNVFAWLELGSDPHASEYPASKWNLREYFSGFTGSAGTFIITQNAAYLWVDFRYFILADKELKPYNIHIFKLGEPGVLSWVQWLAESMSCEQVLGFDQRRISLEIYNEISPLKNRGVIFNGSLYLDDVFSLNLGDETISQIRELPIEVAGIERSHKIKILREFLENKNRGGLLLTRLDDIAWLLNARGEDVSFNPVFYSYFYLDEKVAILFIDRRKVSQELETTWNTEGIELKDYDHVFAYVNTLKIHSLSVDSASANFMLRESISSEIIVEEELSPAYFLKAIKSSLEQQNLRETLVDDSVALVKFFAWLEESYKKNIVLDELQCEQKLFEFRQENKGFIGNSFNTISAVGENSAMCHYRSQPETNLVLNENIYLLDSGGQYEKGTTDITRTVFYGESPTQQQKIDYTLVLKGHVALSRQKFPTGTRGSQLDVFARQFLWNANLDFGHGTGHGIGYCLNVHEGPQRLSPNGGEYVFHVGMITSNEPGVYREGEYGIRIENLICTQEIADSSFLEFETMTYFPYERRLIALELLSEEERVWIDSYHKKCWELISPVFAESTQAVEKSWLENNTKPLEFER